MTQTTSQVEAAAERIQRITDHYILAVQQDPLAQIGVARKQFETALRAELASQQEVAAPYEGATVRPNSQDWASMDGATAFLLIERHADGWPDIRLMMEEWLTANAAAPTPDHAERAIVGIDKRGYVTFAASRAPEVVRAEPVKPSEITLDFKQATELLDMFGGEPSTVTLAPGDGHSGKGLYAYWSEIPEEGAIYLGVTDDEAVPIAEVPCEDCEGRGVVGEARYQGEFQPPEHDPCESCGGSGKWKVAASPSPPKQQPVHLVGGEVGWVPQWQPIEGCVEAMAATRYHVDKTESGFWPYVVRCGTGTQVLHKGHLTSCQRFAQQMTTAFLDGAFVAVNGNKAQSALDATIDQRNRAQRFADEMAAQIAAITGSDIGEHSSSNCPWQQAILAADDFLASQPGHTVEGAMAEQLSGPPVTLETLPVCNCPATGKADPSIHAPNCPARLALTRPKAS